MQAFIRKVSKKGVLLFCWFVIAIFTPTFIGGVAYADDTILGPSHMVIDSGFPNVVVVNTRVIGDGRWRIAEDSDTGIGLMVGVEAGELTNIAFLDKYDRELSDPESEGLNCPGGILGGVPQCLVNPSNPQQSPFICGPIPVDFEQCVCVCASN